MAAVPSIPEFYSGQKIFITGGTGFMGKVLIEKLLRSCPDLHTIYLLIRPKRGKLPQDRIQDTTRHPLFDTIRRDGPTAFDKLRAVAGDVKELGLGLSVEDKEMLQREVTIVFHSAASVRFVESVNDAVLMNVRGTREVVNLALGMEKLRTFIHVSTAYSNVCETGHAAEKLYPPPRGWDWKTVIKLVEMEGSEAIVNCLTPKILGRFIPNTYVFTKALAEQVVNDYRDRLPLVMVRPSIVLGIFSEPLMGWSDNLNGPYGIWVGAYTGLIRSMYCVDSVKLSYVPVDTAVKSLIVIAWHHATSSSSADPDLPVYNCTSMWEPTPQGTLHEIMADVADKYPTNRMIWYPRCQFTPSKTTFYWNLLLLHVPFCILMDAGLKLKGMKPMFAKTCERAYAASGAMVSFVCLKLTFDNAKFLRLAENMLDCDQEDFGYTKVWKTDLETVTKFIIGLRVNFLQDPLETLPEARRKLTRLYWLDKITKGTLFSALFWALSTTSAFHSITALFTW